MWSGFESIGVILLIMAVGFFFAYRQIWPENTQTGLSVIVIKVAAPCLAITSIYASFTRDLLVSSLVLLLIALIHIFVNFLFGKLTSRMLGLSEGKKTIYEVTYTFANIVFIGLPVNQIIFGNEGVPFLFAYYIVNIAIFWSAGYTKIAAAGESADAAAPRARIRIKPQNILNPGFVGVLVGTVLVGTELRLPSVLNTGLGYIANMTVPLSLLIIGANLVVFKSGIPRITKDEWWIMIGKFIISPIVMIALLKLFGIEGLPFYVFLISSIMPCHMQTAILAQNYNVESAYSSKLVGLSTLLSLGTIPAWVAIMQLM